MRPVSLHPRTFISFTSSRRPSLSFQLSEKLFFEKATYFLSLEYGIFLENARDHLGLDVLAFFGFAKAWRRDLWNWIDLAAFGCVWAFNLRYLTRRLGRTSFDDDLDTQDAHFLNLICVTASG